jgi:hypothetical protein
MFKRFLWYAKWQEWPGDPKFITDWNIREFLAYVSSQQVAGY